MPLSKELLEEYFFDYEKVRRQGHTDMFDTHAVSQAAGIPPEAVKAIQAHYADYEKQYVCAADISPHALVGMKSYGTVNAHYDDLVTLYSEASSFRDKMFKDNIHWIVLTTFGAAMIYCFMTPKGSLGYDDVVQPVKRLEDATQWHINAYSQAAYDAILAEIHRYVMAKRSET